MTRGTLGATLMAAAILVAAGCSFIKSFDGFTNDCEPDRWPGRPQATDTKNDKNVIFGATRSIRVPEKTDKPGYDLDNLCTCPDRPACINKSAVSECDQPHGVDNKAGPLLSTFRVTREMLEDGVKRGVHGVFVKIENYNGAANDAEVTVSLFNVVGVNGATDGKGAARFDDDDRFVPDLASTTGVSGGGPVPRYVGSGYVNGYTLVASFAAFDLRLVLPQPGGPAVILERIESVRLVGKIDIDKAKQGGKLSMNGALLVGRILFTKMFSQASAASSCVDGGYPIVRETVCSFLDLSASEGRDGKNDPCAAISFGLTLDVAPAFLEDQPVATDAGIVCPDLDAGCN